MKRVIRLAIAIGLLASPASAQFMITGIGGAAGGGGGGSSFLLVDTGSILLITAGSKLKLF